MEKRAALRTAPALYQPSSGKTRKFFRTIFGADWQIAFPFVLPVVIIMTVFILWPFINAILLSFTVRSLATRSDQYVGLMNYARLLEDSDFIGAVSNTIGFTIVSLCFKFVIGMAVALMLNSRLPFRSVLTGVILLPWIVPEVVTALTWRSIYDPIFGGLNPVLSQLGLISRPIGWLSEPSLALPSVIAVNVWKGLPFYILLLLAGLKAIDREQLEAAEVDGANIIQRFRNITLPSLRYVIISTLLLSAISTFNTFGLVYLMTGGGPGGATRLFSILAYEKAIIGLRFGPGVATTLMIAPVLAIFIFLLSRFMRQDHQNVHHTGVTRMDRVTEMLGRIISIFLDLIFMPFEWIFEKLNKLRLIGQAALSREQGERRMIALRLVLLVPVFIFVLFPFYWILITSFKSDLQIQQFSSIYWPNPWTTEQFETLIFKTQFITWFYNTVLVATGSTAISVALAALAAYALARLRFRGAGIITNLLLITYLLPGSLLFIPLYRILTTLGVINTHLGLLLTYPTFLIPFATWVLMGYYRSIPADLEEAALMDGASRFEAFWKITLPLASPALLSVTLFAFTNAWNEFLFAFVFINSENLKTLPVGLQLLVFGDIYPWGQLMAASLLMAIPVVVIYIFAQRYFVEGLTAGSVKG